MSRVRVLSSGGVVHQRPVTTTAGGVLMGVVVATTAGSYANPWNDGQKEANGGTNVAVSDRAVGEMHSKHKDAPF